MDTRDTGFRWGRVDGEWGDMLICIYILTGDVNVEWTRSDSVEVWAGWHWLCSGCEGTSVVMVI